MKKWWCYIFYFTWQVYVSIDNIFVEPSVTYLCRLFPFLNKYKKKSFRAYSYVMNNIECGYNIIFSYRCMLLTTTIIIANLEIIFFYTFKTSLVDITNYIFSVELERKVNFIMFFISSLVFSYWINEFFLQWERSGYINYFKCFEKENRENGFLLAFLFHFGAVFVFICLVFIFNL